MRAAPEIEIQSVDSPLALGPRSLLGVCTSLKPAPGVSSRSAARTLLTLALKTVAAVYPDAHLLDLRSRPIPQFDGRLVADIDDDNVRFVATCVERAGSLLVSVPAYWSGVSGVFKNLVDVLCGPSYDLEGSVTILTNVPVGLIVIGADEASAAAGTSQAVGILESTGASVIGDPVTIANPRTITSGDAHVFHALSALAAQTAIAASKRPTASS